MANLNIYRGASVLYTVGIDENTVYNGQVVGENEVKASFDSPVKLTLLIGDYIQHDGQTFKINQPVEEKKNSSLNYSYSVTFEGLEYSLYNKIIEHLGTPDFDYFGTPDTLLDLIIENINLIDGGWVKGDVEVIAGGKFVSFNNESCRQALTKVAEAFELEFSFDGKTINLVKTIGELIPGLVFEYGMEKGLYSLNRKPVMMESFGTRFKGYGGTQNIPADYRSGKKRLSFDPGFIDKNVGVYGIIERPVIFDYIFPKRTGYATAIPEILKVVDSTLDFNLNDVIVDGQAKIVFKSGDLQGNEFEIASYNNTTKTITFNANVEENGYTLPNATVKAEIGDEYTLIGIEMPYSPYITAAEAELEAATEEYAETFKNPFYAYDLPIDEKFIRDNGLVGVLKRGDRVRVVDAPMSVDTTLRIQSISYPLCNPAKIQATISDTVSYTVAEQVLKTIAKQSQQISIVYKNVSEVNRDLAIKQREFQNRVFDPDGYFDGGKIKPESIETLSMSSGARSQQFTLSIIFQPNYEANANSVLWSDGTLVHNTIDDNGVKTWYISNGNRSDLVTLEPYYIYAKCLKNGNTGTIVIDTASRRVNDDADFFYFLIGQLSSVIGGVRWPQLTYGTSTVNGRFMTTGRIQSANLQSYIDLDTNQFNFGNNISGIDYNVTAPNQLTVRGHIEATSGTIAGVAITAGSNFSLDGTRVKIRPDEGIAIFNNGYLKVPTGAPYSGALTTGEAAIWVGSLSGITNVPGSDYVLPTATASVLGGVKIGSGLSVDGNGVISVSALGGVTSFNSRTGAIGLTNGDVTTALGFTPYSNANPTGFITSSALTAYQLISGLGSAAFLGASVSAVANSVVKRDTNGYVEAVYYRDTNTSIETSTPTYLYGGVSDGYLYKYDLSKVKSFLNLDSYLLLSGGNLTGVISAVHSTPGNNSADFENTSVTGYGLYSKGGGGSAPNYEFRFDNYLGSVIMSSSLGQVTFTGNITAPTFIGALTGNSLTATTLATTRTIWGQNFNGSGNVVGALTGVTDLTASGLISVAKIKTTDYLSVPTSAPSITTSGEAYIWVGSLSGITTVPGSDYVLPIATASVLGGVKIGSGLTITSGVISVSALGGVTSFNSRTGAISLTSGDVTTALGFTPYSNANPSDFITTSALSPYQLISGLGSAAYLDASVTATANSVVKRDGSGYLQGVYLKDTNTSIEIVTPSYLYGGLNDGFLYKFDSAKIKTFLSLGANAYTSTAYAALSGAVFTGELRTNMSLSGYNCGDFENTSATGYGLYSMGGNGGYYSFRFDEYNGFPVMNAYNGNVNIGYGSNQGYRLAVNGTAFIATQLTSPVIQATAVFKIPTTAPGVGALATGEACLWIGSLSGITT
jgi:hypothetical protein